MVKKVGYCVYAHKSNLKEFFNNLTTEDSNIALQNINKYHTFFPFDVVKFDKKTKNTSLIKCPTWNYLNEPIVEDSLCIKQNGSYKIISGGTKVYHNKWQFVGNDYLGFDIEKAKFRTALWNTIPDIKGLKSKIGMKDFWYRLLEKNNIDI